MADTGRPCKLTPELQDTLCKALGLGLYVETACLLAGIAKDTFYNWVNEGESKKSGKFRQFSDAIKKAQAESETRWIAHIVQDDSWTSKAWLLERKFKDRWGRAIRQEISGPQGGPIVTQAMSAEEKEELQARIRRGAEEE
jgi:transposase